MRSHLAADAAIGLSMNTAATVVVERHWLSRRSALAMRKNQLNKCRQFARGQRDIQ